MAKKKRNNPNTQSSTSQSQPPPNTQNPPASQCQHAPTQIDTQIDTSSSQTSSHSDEVEKFYDADEAFPIQKPGYPFLDDTIAGIFHITEEPYYPPVSHIVTTNHEYPLYCVNKELDFCLIFRKYDYSLKDYLRSKGQQPVRKFVTKNGLEALVPLDYARQLARGVINAFIEIGSEEHGLNMIDNYVVIKPTNHPHKNSLLHDDYDQDIQVKIIRKVIHPIKRHHTNTAAKRNKAVMLIIFKHIFAEQHLNEEWQDFLHFLRMGELEYCLGHPCLKKWEPRLLSFVKLSTMISNRGGALAKMVYEAMTECTMNQLYMDTWEQKIHGHPPLEQVLDFHTKKETEFLNKVSTYIYTAPGQTTSRQRRNYGGNIREEKWVEGGLLVKFVGNCYRHLTETLWMSTNFKERTYKIDEAAIQGDKDYRQLRFLDTLITHFVYPGLLVALYREFHDKGYDL